MPANISLPDSARHALTALMGQLPPDVPTSLDPANSLHRDAITAALNAAGRDATRYPALHGATAGGHQPDHLVIADMGQDTQARATAMVLHAANGPTLLQGGTLFVSNSKTGELLAAGANSNVQEGFMPVSTDTANAKPPTGDEMSVLAIHHSVTPDHQVRFTAIANTARAGLKGIGPDNINVSLPTQTPKNGRWLIIAVGRKPLWIKNVDADYWYTEPDNVEGSPYLIVPFAGTCQMPYQVKGTAGSPIAGAVYSSVIYFVTSSTQTVNLYTPAATVAAKIILTNPNLITWNFPYDQKSYKDTGSLVYNPQALVNEKISYFFFKFTVPIQSPPMPDQPFTVCSVNTPGDKSPNCKIIPNVMFWWHCLDEKTQVTMAGGNKLALAEIDNSHRVVTDLKGGTLGVEATTTGMHTGQQSQRGADAVYRLQTKSGFELIGSGLHAIVTTDGLCALCDLKPDAQVITERGPDAVASCQAITWQGRLVNLKLGNEQDAISADTIGTYFANGILVGDHLAMHRDRRRIHMEVDNSRNGVPAALKTDYASAVSDIQY
ncbi:hypothetical protein [Bradyrhizobium sp. 21]|uniref:hypothetical protein n=1 Tax=Bradyrhizobium sp. 21 TaxID=2782666 RepID=UPI001FFADF51|nr:hypothetical protein [Bradyrhizobium sp. 21]MCK1387633.1 hypothetical protein [Bradyrhizobium sp. 21]